jgi:hypothetical protein
MLARLLIAHLSGYSREDSNGSGGSEGAASSVGQTVAEESIANTVAEEAAAWCSFFDRKKCARTISVPTSAGVKLLHACVPTAFLSAGFPSYRSFPSILA